MTLQVVGRVLAEVLRWCARASAAVAKWAAGEYARLWRRAGPKGKLILALVTGFFALTAMGIVCDICGVSPGERPAAVTAVSQSMVEALPVSPTDLPTSIPQPSSTPRPTATPTRAPEPTPTSLPSPAPSPTAATPSGILKVHFIDVGQGEAVLIQAPDGKVALIDGGEEGSGVLRYLQGQGVKRVDLMVATHPHNDHIGGLIGVLQAMPVDQVVTNGQMHTTTTYEAFLDAIDIARVPYAEAKRGDTLQLGTLTLQVLHPTSSEGDDLNDNSLVLRFEYAGTSFLLTGDVQAEGQAGILAAGQPIQATILAVPHHGSAASSRSFLASVKPEVAVYSCGVGNDYGHPHTETLAALASVGAQVYGTDVNGTVVVTCDATGYQVTPSRGGPRAPPKAAPVQLPTEAAGDGCVYIANSNTGKFHYAWCSSVKQMNEEHKVCYATREGAVAAGYVPCGRCNP